MAIQQSTRFAGCVGRTISGIALAVSAVLASAASAQSSEAFIPTLSNSSTIPSNGDVNPYGVAFVPEGFPSTGMLKAGDVLVANFNNSANIQGTGTTITLINPGKVAIPFAAPVFFTSPLTGLSTALGVLRAGFVLVGNVPTSDGTVGTIGQGALQVINRYGKVVQTWTDPVMLDGPWDLTVDDHGSWAHVFVSNVLNGTVARIDVSMSASGLTVTKKTLVAAGYTHEPNSAALVLGPTGLAFDDLSDTLFVASTADNAIYAVSQASRRSSAYGRGTFVFSDHHLRGPLALRFAPNGNLITANGDAVNPDPLHPSEIVEFTRYGSFVSEYNVDASQGGAFGIDTVLDGNTAFNYAVVDDVTNSISVYRLPAYAWIP